MKLIQTLYLTIILVYRFKPLKQTFLSSLSNPIGQQSSGSYSGISSPIENEKATDNGRLLPMTTKASSNDESYNMEYSKKFLPPLWVDVQEEIERHLEEIQQKSIKFTSLYL